MQPRNIAARAGRWSAQHRKKAIIGWLLFVALATVIGFGSDLTLLGRIGPDRAAYVSVVFPIVSLGLSTLFEGYHWTGTAFAGVLLILIGNLVVLMRWPARGWRGKPWEKSEGRTA